MGQTIVVFNSALPKVRQVLASHAKVKPDEVTIVKQKEAESTNNGQASVLELDADNFQKVIAEVLSKLKKDLDYGIEKTEYFTDPKDYTEQTFNALKHTNDMLQRAYGRRTGMLSWILLHIFKKIGFQEDNYGAIQDVLKDPDFIKNFTEYYREVEIKGTKEAHKFLDTAFPDDQKKKGLAKFALFNMNACKFIQERVRQYFPIAFSIQNLLTPVCARIFEGGILGKVFDFLRMINPWVGEFIAEPMGLYKHEIGCIKKDLPIIDKLQDPVKQETETGEAKLNQINSVEITNLDSNEYKLKHIVKKAQEAFERIFGRQTTLSSLLVTGLLKFNPDKDLRSVQGFNKYVSDNNFMKQFYQYLEGMNKLAAKKKASKEDEKKLLDDTFGKEDHNKIRFAKILSGAISFVVTVPKDFIEKAPKYFGLPYSIQYLLMPIVTKILGKESLLGKLLGILRDVNPILNDLFFDPVAIFQEEIKVIRQEAEPMKELLQMKMPEGIRNAWTRAKSFVQTAQEFALKYVPKVRPATQP